MALLNPPQILPNVLDVLLRTLRGADGFAMTVDDLARLTAPASLTSNVTAENGSKGLGDTLRACVAMGIVDRDGGTVTLSRDLEWVRDKSVSDDVLRTHLADRILDANLNGDLWSSSEEGSRPHPCAVVAPSARPARSAARLVRRSRRRRCHRVAPI